MIRVAIDENRHGDSDSDSETKGRVFVGEEDGELEKGKMMV